LLLAAGNGWAAGPPALLIASPQGAAYGYVDLNYLKELHQQGFEVDYTDRLDDLTWERIQRYNVLVVYTSPDAWDVTMRGQRSSPEKVEAFVALMERYLDAGGGVFLMAPEYNLGKQVVAELTDRWGAKLPVEIIVENDPEKVGPMTHSCQATPLAFTDQVLPSPVSEGVRQLWYPLQPAYNGGMSGPLWVDESWQVVVKASKTAVSKPVDTSQSPNRIAHPFVRPEGVAEPPLMAIRDLKAGRVALICQWQQFSLGSGTKWIFNREVLEKGLKDKPSDFGRLLQNTFRWLAEPSLKSGVVGGYVTPPERLEPPNAREEVKQEYAEKVWPYDPAALGHVEVPAHWKLYRGLIGAKSAFSSGAGTVEEYAQAARQAGLDFVIFMEDFDRLTPAKFEQLKAECRQHSSDKVLLLPGFHIVNNIGNHMFFYGPDPVWPPDLVLTGPNQSVLYIQEEDAEGNFTGYLTPFLDWVLGAYHVDKGQVGYFHFADSPHGMRLPDCRLYAAAGVRYYRHGQLVEDLTREYLTTAQCTIPPAPMSVNEVASPAELLREVESGHALTYALATSLDTTTPTGIFQGALRWSHQYDSLPVFLSDGPKILAWTGCHRVWTYGGEEFVRGPAVMPSPMAVTAEQGLREIRIYNGEQLFRRFLFSGEKEFQQTLVLDGTIQKNLVLIAEDRAGGKAISFARRCWKDGALAPSFCSDHVNDGQMFLAHGPYYLPFNNVPALPANIAGDTWDGGPPAALPLSNYQDTLPVLDSDQGREEGFRLDQVPVLEFSDEGAVAVATVRREAYDERLKQVVNPWHTYGPLAGPSRLFDNVQRYRQYVTRTVGVPDSGWAAPGVRVGVNASLFRNETQFKRDLTVNSLRVGMLRRNPAAYLVLGGAGGAEASASAVQVVDLGEEGYPTFQIQPGDWFGFYGKGLMNAQIFFNRGETLHLKLTGALEWYADLEGQTVKKGDRYTVEWAALGFPLDVPVASAADLQRYVAYLQQPTGLQVLRGRRLDGPGLVEFAPDEGAVELSLPQPAPRLDLTLPVRIRGLNPRWSAGLFQKQGYSKGFYGPGENRYRALGLDFAGNAYVPLYVDAANTTHVVAGHPIVAGPEGEELFLQVTNVGGTPDRWHVSVNNPTDREITTTLHAAMALPGLDFPDRTLTLKPGEYVVVQ